jgi:hypothetical protein
MKKKLTLLAAFCVALTTCVFAQATPNAGFESWTHNSFPSYDTPDSWNCTNSQTSITGVYACLKSSSFHTGTYSVQLITKSIGAPLNQLIPGVVTTGTLPTSSTGSITGGIAYTSRPDSISGWYGYTPQGGETGMISFMLFGSGGMSDTIAVARFITPSATVTAFKRFSAPLVYRSANAVVNSIWLLASSNNDGATAGVGSTLWADDLNLVTNPASGITEYAKAEISVGPNPASDVLYIRNPGSAKASIALYDVMGRKVSEQKINGTSINVDLNSTPEGLYIYSITDEHTTVLKTGKVIIRK